MEAFLLVLIGLFFIPVTVLLRGFVIATVWKWFAVTAFGLPVLSITQAIGLSILLFAFIPYEGKEVDGDTARQRFIRTTIKSILQPLFTLGFAYIVKLFL